ncbi:hypothetical protein KY092_11440 [Natronomonas gomsonensis]|uniref:hypothetical protein n=1 Tax=Natronomonas gomsonensis TaxID=1046043 RepID=UPI0020CA4D29|nr:hypothetical protein [Natronomonas gomsonensis]MCY4731168.1 hypothetical protein [Natronomonas gomsonensis]
MTDSFHTGVGLLALSGVAIVFFSFLGQHGVYTAIAIITSWFLALPWFDKGYVVGIGLIGLAVTMTFLRDYFRGLTL